MFLAIFLCFSPMISSSILAETSPAQYVELIDQQYCELNDPVQAHIYNNYLAQSFIPSKPVLSSVDLQLIYPNSDVNVTIYKAKVNGYPDLSNPLTNISTNVFHSYGNYGFWYKFDFLDILVVPGDIYFIRVEVLEENSICNWVQGANGYENGSAWSFLLRDDFGFEHTVRDYFFRTYYSTTGFYPVADAGPDRQVLMNNLVNFSGAGSYDPDWQALTYIWYSGGEIINEGMEFQYGFTYPGIFTVNLTVIDETGLADTDSCIITVSEPELPPNQMPMPIIEAEGYLGHYYNLPANHSDMEGPITGIVTGDSPFNHDWYDEQYYSFTRLDPNLTFGNDFFPVNEGMPGDPLYFAVHWETTIEVQVTGNYSFEIGSDDDSWVYVDDQMVCDLGGTHALAISAHTVNLTVGQHELDIYFAERRSVQSGFYFSLLNETIKPAIRLTDFNGTIQVFANQTIELSAEKSYDPDGTVVHYAWNFGDGVIEYNATVSHAYATEGEYSFNLFVLDDDESFAKGTILFEVLSEPEQGIESESTVLDAGYESMTPPEKSNAEIQIAEVNGDIPEKKSNIAPAIAFTITALMLSVIAFKQIRRISASYLYIGEHERDVVEERCK